MSDAKTRHIALTTDRNRAFRGLFGAAPTQVYPFHMFDEDAEDIFIDVLVYPLTIGEQEAVVAVTNGLSDAPMTDPDTGEVSRFEIVQYFPECDEDLAARLYDVAWLPRFDNLVIDEFHTIEWPEPATEGSPLKNSLLLRPLVRPHREFEFRIDGDVTTLLWHVPISDAELAYKNTNGINALIERMQVVRLPWLFDEQNRPSLVPN